ncbi:hypothetical protein DEO72_LG8g1882 [Vigna unguiculata]|uniref:Uncharacterized protein n=1 Tax=Vigna unguiculata TaxID=3917 RepID=A0A4D6MQZ8_VIGUN|nr:hypothetical protein DEO72_LG8g1882 [Vigna unguiculata]
MCGKTCYGSYTVTPGRVSIYEHSPYRPKTTKLVSQQLRRAIYLDPSVLATTSTLTPATLANPSHNSRVPRVHPPSRATTQGFLVSRTAKRAMRQNSFRRRYRLAVLPSPPGACHSVGLCCQAIA